MKTGKPTAHKPEAAACDTCGVTAVLTTAGDEKLCPACASLLDALVKDKQVTEKLLLLAGISVPPAKQVELELPDVLDAVRYRTADRERNTWYVSVSELDGNPVEIFASTAFDRDQHLQSRISNLTTITRLISLLLRHIFLGERLTLEKTLTQLQRSSRMPDDLPEMLGKILANYSKKKPLETGKDPLVP
jgi:hypothetical protein